MEEVIKDTWRLEYIVFSHENGLKFSKKIGISPKISVTPEKGLHFLRDALNVALP